VRSVVAYINGEVIIQAPVEVVFDVVADERNEPKYNPRIVRAEKITDGPVGAGTLFIAEPKGAGSKGQMTLEVIEYDRPRRVHNIVRSSYMHVEGTVSFEAVGGATRLKWDWNMRLIGPMRMVSPLLALVGPRWERRNWLGLKAYLESGRASSEDPGASHSPGREDHASGQVGER
jgi:hypothetical protein